MATSPAAKAPYEPQDHKIVAEMVRGLNERSKLKKGKAKKTTYQVSRVEKSPNGSQKRINHAIDSWRFQDYDYKTRGLPTYARGLFTRLNSEKQYEIVVRGYDKFFNTDEVHETKWENIKTKTQGPYELTLKENGCIIFIAGLDDGTLVVCSKHSTGDRSDVQVSHASAGDRWVDKQLATLGKTREEFALELYSKNITAVAELCDDEFEEHILAYGPERSGLYLHGININSRDFKTYPSNLVQKFADDWGFRQVGVQVFEDINTVKTFLETVAETGAHEGRDVEGFVIRCRMSGKPGELPYQDWFFKYKFEEPYLMYRQWRECTKALIAHRQPRYKKHTKITAEYLKFADKRLKADSSLAKAYNQNHGIIGLRDEFLAFKNLKGSDAANWATIFGEDMSAVSDDVVLVPIATIGCGKTTVGMSLSHLFGWGIVQNDNIQGKNRPAQMVSQVVEQLAEKPVVISDRNNSERREREQIIKDIKMKRPGAKVIALNFAHGDIEEVRRITRERVLKRGDNHQTIQAASDQNKVIGIMENFIHRFQPCDPNGHPDDGFDLIINLDPTQGSRANVEAVVNSLQDAYPTLIPNTPSAEAVDEVTRAVIENYTPDIRHTIPDRKDKKNKGGNQQQPGQKKEKPKSLEYMAISVPASEVNLALGAAFRGTGPEEQRFYKQLQQTRRVQPLFHVTLMHRASANEHTQLWQQYLKAHAENGSEDSGKLGDCDVQLERVVFDDRIMAIVVRLLNDGDDQWKCVNKVAHITVGTRDNSVKPKESNDLLARWLEVGSSQETGIADRVFADKPILKGTVRGVLSR